MIGTSAMRKATFQAIQHGERRMLFLLGRNKKPLTSSDKVVGLLCTREARRWMSDGQSVSSESSASNAAEEYDIIIAGGGLVGTALACSLGKDEEVKDTAFISVTFIDKILSL